MTDSDIQRRHRVLAFLAYLAFVIYGSLIPFEMRSLTLDQAIVQFSSIRFLDLGIVSRADWIANILLYIPLAFLGGLALSGLRNRRSTHFAAAVPVLVLCLLLAVALEFVQVFFSPRTVSLNDLLAETIGSLGGVSLFLFGHRRILWLWDSFRQGGRPSVLAAIAVFSIAYLALSLFPFDFVVSLQELGWKLKSGNQGWVIADSCQGGIRCIAVLAGEAVVLLPLGGLLALAYPGIGPTRALSAGLLLGLVLESAQLLMASGTAQGLSVPLRGIGIAAGVIAGHQLQRIGPKPFAHAVWRTAKWGVALYILTVMALNGWFSTGWQLPADLVERLAAVPLTPFYYHYWTTETMAMASLQAQMALYSPIGLALWARSVTFPVRRSGTGRAAISAAVLATPIELGKLFLVSMHPDLTNVLIAAAGAAATFSIAGWVERALSGPPADSAMPASAPAVAPAPIHQAAAERHPTAPTPPVFAVGSPPSSKRRRRRSRLVTRAAGVGAVVIFGLRAALGAATGLAALSLLWHYPVGRLELALALTAYAVLLWRHPKSWLLVVPAVLPALDLVPWTGWFYWDSTDFFLALTIAVVPWRLAPHRYDGVRVPFPTVLLSLLALSYGIGIFNGLFPLEPLDANAFSSYFSRYNSLRVAKGFVWALLLLPLLRSTLKGRAAIRNYLLPGIATGFAIVLLAIILERQQFSGLLNFTADFRVTGTFSTMHTGGGHIEGYLIMALPLLLVVPFVYHSLAARLLVIPLLVLGGYGLLVTFARAGISALGVSILLLWVGLPRAWLKSHGRHLPPNAALFAGVIGILAFVTYPILKGDFLQQRFSQIHHDFEVRAEHWGNTLNMMDNGLSTALVGMGIGRFPETFLIQNPQNSVLGAFRFAREDDNRYLGMSAGDSLYYEQKIDLEPHRDYTLALDLRSSSEKPRFIVPVCAKSILYSESCEWLSIKGIQSDGEWHSYRIQFNSGKLGEGPWYSRRPLKLSLFNPAADTIIDVDNVRLLDGDGTDLIRNGDFSAGFDHWYFATDNHLPWHTKQLWIQLYFEQGLLGSGLFTLFTVLVLLRLWRLVRRGDVLATGLLAALAGFLSVGMFASLFDAPRLTLLYYLLAFVALLLPPADQQSTKLTN